MHDNPVKLSRGKINVSCLNCLTTSSRADVAIWEVLIPPKQATQLLQIEEKAKPNTNIKTQRCLPSTKFSLTTANEFCIQFFGSFKDETCYFLHTTPHFKKLSYNFPCYKTFKKYGDIKWTSSIGVTPCIMLLISDLVNGFNDDERHWKSSASLHIMGMWLETPALF